MLYFIIFILIIGIFEITSNIFHLSKGTITNIGLSAKRQHQELPLDIKEIHFFVKAIIMLVFGLLFLTAGILYFMNPDEYSAFNKIIFISFGAYGLCQAIWYRKTINVWPAAVVYNIPLIIFLLFK